MTKLETLQNVAGYLEKGEWIPDTSVAEGKVGKEEMIIKCDDGIIIAKHKTVNGKFFWFPAYFTPKVVKTRLEHLLTSAQKEVAMIEAHLQAEAERA
ncbi:MAG: hypothetical protein NTX81_01670 [Candidatus Bathyarchaeota archaeon]|nr:hypothetical protein [Candidatus Bathyarchaeota archaeon]